MGCAFLHCLQQGRPTAVGVPWRGVRRCPHGVDDVVHYYSALAFPWRGIRREPSCRHAPASGRRRRVAGRAASDRGQAPARAPSAWPLHACCASGVQGLLWGRIGADRRSWGVWRRPGGVWTHRLRRPRRCRRAHCSQWAQWAHCQQWLPLCLRRRRRHGSVACRSLLALWSALARSAVAARPQRSHCSGGRTALPAPRAAPLHRGAARGVVCRAHPACGGMWRVGIVPVTRLLGRLAHS